MKLSLAPLVIAFAGCTESLPPPSTAAEMKTPAPPSTCPLGVQGARVVYEETTNGARLTFTAPPDLLDDLRQRARNAAELHGPGKKLGEGHDGRHGMGGDHGLKPAQLPPASATEQDLEGGARVDLAPVDPNDLATLRAKVQLRARDLMASCS